MYTANNLVILVCAVVFAVVGARPLSGDNIVVTLQEDTDTGEYVRVVREASPHLHGHHHHHHHHHHHPHYSGFDGYEGVPFGGGVPLGGGVPFGGGFGGSYANAGSFGGGVGGLGGFGGGFADSTYANAGSFSTEIDTPFFDFRYSGSNANAYSGGSRFTG